MSDELVSRAEGGTHYLMLNRPHRRNALTPDIARELARAIDELEETGTAQVVVLSGAGGHFCAGLDLHWFRGLGAVPDVPELQHGLRDFQSAVLAIVRCPVPVVAVLQGTAAGFGLDLACACDMRIAGRSATLSSAFARMGLVPDGGSTFTLPRLVGLGRALRLLMTGETLDAGTAFDIGLVEEVVDDETLDAAVHRLLDKLHTGDPMSIRAMKRLARAAEVGALEQALSAEGALQLAALQSPAFHRRLEAFTARTGSSTSRP